MSAIMRNAVFVVLAMVLFGCRGCRNNEGEIEPGVQQAQQDKAPSQAVQMKEYVKEHLRR